MTDLENEIIKAYGFESLDQVSRIIETPENEVITLVSGNLKMLDIILAAAVRQKVKCVLQRYGVEPKDALQ